MHLWVVGKLPWDSHRLSLISPYFHSWKQNPFIYRHRYRVICNFKQAIALGQDLTSIVLFPNYFMCTKCTGS